MSAGADSAKYESRLLLAFTVKIKTLRKDALSFYFIIDSHKVKKTGTKMPPRDILF